MHNYVLCFQRTTKNPKFVDAKVSYLQIGRTYGEIGEKYGRMIRQTVAAKTESGVRVGQRHQPAGCYCRQYFCKILKLKSYLVFLLNFFALVSLSIRDFLWKTIWKVDWLAVLEKKVVWQAALEEERAMPSSQLCQDFTFAGHHTFFDAIAQILYQGQ